MKQEKIGLGSRSATWIAAGTLAVAAASVAPALSFAEPPAFGGHSGHGAQAPVVQFDIPAGPLQDVLAQFSKATGVRAEIHLPPDQMTGFHSAGVRGPLSLNDALTAILRDTGLGFHLNAAGTRAEIQIQNAEQVSVVASTNSVALGQFTEALTDTPQTVNVVPQYILQEQAATTLKDSLRNAPGISMAAGESGQQGDNLTIRGFSARNDIYLDGIRDFGSYYRDAFDYEAVDVIQGPASVEFGRGSTGGVVNQESKQAVTNEFIRTNFQFGTDAMRRGTADINIPLSKLVAHSAFRVNVLGTESGVAERDVALTRRWAVASALSFGLGTATRFTVQHLHEYENSIPDYGLPYFGTAVAPVARTNYYGFKNFSYIKTVPDVLTARFEQDINANWNYRATARFGTYPRDTEVVEPQINTAGVITGVGPNLSTSATTPVYASYTVTCSPTAATPCYPVNTPLSQVLVKRALISRQATDDMLWFRNELTGRVRIHNLENDVVFALEGGRERSNPYAVTYTLPTSTGFTSAIAPTYNDPFAPITTVVGVTTRVNSQSYGLNALDTLKLRPWLILSGGIRFDYFNTHSTTPATATAAAIDLSNLTKQPTYRAAIVVKPKPNGTFYFDYGTSFNPSAESLSLSANTATAPPEENTTYEWGTKWDLLHNKLNVNGSYFRTTKLNARETDPNNTANSILSGTQRVNGVQVGAVGHVGSHFDVIAGYAYLNGIVISSILNASPYASINTAFYADAVRRNPTNPLSVVDPRYNTAPYYVSPVGSPFANVPRNSGNVWVTHSIGWRFVGGFGGNYIAARRASSTGTIATYNTTAAVPITSAIPFAFKAIPGYVLLNAMISRPITEKLSVQANFINLANKFFIDTPHPNHLIPGEGFNTQFSATYRF